MLFDTRESGVTGNFQFLITQRSSSTGKQRFLYYNTDGYKLMSGYDYPTAAWYHIVFSKSGTSTTWYVNGSAVSTFTDVNDASNDQFRIGANKTLGNDYSGQIDEFAIFDKALSASEVTTAYNEGITGDLTSLSPVVWWRMGDATTPAADGTGSHSGTTFVLDQANTTLGSEMVIADAYVADEWYAYANTTMTFGDNFMRCEHDAAGDSNGWFTYLRTSASDNSILTATPTTDNFYLLTFDVESDDADAYVYMKLGNVASTILQGTGNGTKTVVYKKGSVSHEDYLEGRNLSQGKYMKISNVSVKPINGTTLELLNNTAISDSNVPS
jgi:hypothetical protein